MGVCRRDSHRSAKQEGGNVKGDTPIFYRLDSPSYLTDVAMSRTNPCKCTDPVSLPGVYCSACNEIWAGSNRIRTELFVSERAEDIIQSHKLKRFGVPLDQFQELCREISSSTKIPLERLRPGAKICPPTGTLRSSKLRDFTHPFPGLMWVTKQVKTVLESAELKGISFAAVNLRWTGKMKNTSVMIPDLWEVVVNGKAWRQGSDLQTITSCSVCGRMEYRRGGTDLTVDESRWDGSDFFHVDENPNIVIVTENVTQILSQGNFTNYVYEPVSS